MSVSAGTLAPPLDLPRLVMRRASALGVLVLALALVLGLARMDADIDDEVDAAMALAGTMAQLGQLGQLGSADEAGALQALRAAQSRHPLRHLSLQVQAEDGRMLLGPPAAEPAAAPLRWLLALHQRWLSVPDARRVSWPVQRADGSRWTVTLAATHDSERREAMGSLLGMLGLLLLGVAGLLAVMQWNVRRALAPLGRLLQAIAGIEGRDVGPVQALPPMPIRELEQVAAALRHLGAALHEAEAGRRRLQQQLLTLQDEERARLAQDLHDEFGQRLTALRVDAAWLTRRLAGDATLLPVAQGMAGQCAQLQQDIRGVLGRLQPFGPARPVADGAEPAESLAAGVALLQALVQGWGGAAGAGRPDAAGMPPAPLVRLQLQWQGDDGQPQPWPDADTAARLALPRALWLTLYRISQEALTNAARHAGATRVELRLGWRGAPRPGAMLVVAWSVCDDGTGVAAPEAALPRGNGLAGIRQRVWAQGADLQMGPAQAGSSRPGWRLAADFHTRLLPAPEAA